MIDISEQPKHGVLNIHNCKHELAVENDKSKQPGGLNVRDSYFCKLIPNSNNQTIEYQLYVVELAFRTTGW